jgi:chromosome segregation ATPase
MFTPKIGSRRLLSICSAALILTLCMACPAPVKEDTQLLNSRILAENSTMKKRLPLIERENDVLKKENLQHRMKVMDLESQIKQLGLELADLNDKYAKDMTAGAEQINKLQETIQRMEQDNTARIQDLTSRNVALKAEMVREVQDLKNQMANQNDAHIQERKRIMQENAQREFDLTARLDMLKKSLEAKDLEIASRKMAMDEISSKLGEAIALSDTLKKARDEAVAELESVKAANADLTRKVDELSSLAGSLKTSRAAAITELESAKAANAELAKKMNALAKQPPPQKEAPLKNNN